MILYLILPIVLFMIADIIILKVQHRKNIKMVNDYFNAVKK